MDRDVTVLTVLIRFKVLENVRTYKCVRVCEGPTYGSWGDTSYNLLTSL